MRSSSRKGFPRRLILGLAFPLLLGLAACRSPESVAPQEPSATSISLLDQQLLEVVTLEEELNQDASREDADYWEIQRRFEQVAGLYSGLVARNPDDLETRLLYGKFLSRYNDTDGALKQFEDAADIILRERAKPAEEAEFTPEELDAALAVVYQDQSTVFAEIGDPALALFFAAKTAELQPARAAYQFGLGQVLAAFRQELIQDNVLSPEQLDADMLEAFHSACQLQPDDLSLQFRYGQAFYDVASPDWQAALDHWESLASHPGLSTLQLDAIRLHQARCLIGLGHPDQARARAETVSSPEFRDSARALFDLDQMN